MSSSESSQPISPTASEESDSGYFSLEVVDTFKDKLWRLNNLYKCVDEHGVTFDFKTNWVQEDFYNRLWYLNLCLKARQLGFSTFIDLYILDDCIFFPNQQAAIIAHSLDDAKKLFRTKIKFPYDHLPDAIRNEVHASNDSANELVFSNGSSVAVSTSVRSGTVQLLHISEFGKISARYPDKADEIVTGSFNAVHQGNMIFVESTAEGHFGRFYEMCKAAEDHDRANRPLTQLDFKFFFYPWWRHPANSLSSEDTANTVVVEKYLRYFHELEFLHGIALTDEQKAWYVKKAATQGSLMLREHPSTPKEAFQAAIEGAYFAEEMALAREQGRVARVPYTPALAVDTWWDLGMDDSMTLWFVQIYGREVRLINYFEGSGQGIGFYIKHMWKLRDDKRFGYRYGKHYAPHDIAVREIGSGVTRWAAAKKLGLKFEIVQRLPEVADKQQAARDILPLCYFDEVNADVGIGHLEAYRKQWNDRFGRWDDHPHEDIHIHGADAFMTGAVAVGARFGMRAAQPGPGQASGRLVAGGLRGVR